MSISREKNGDRYKVQITLQRRTFYMGYYSTYEEAVAANAKAALRWQGLNSTNFK